MEDIYNDLCFKSRNIQNPSLFGIVGGLVENKLRLHRPSSKNL